MKYKMANTKRLFMNHNMHNTQGIALVAALILMAVLSIIGATVLTATSTEIAISGNYRRGIEAFYLAEAGIAEGRARLRGDLIANPRLIEDPVKSYDARWSAYILTSASWMPTDDETFYKRQTNYFPVNGNQTNSTVIANSLQVDLPYWVKIKHKTEYDAEREGHRAGTPHYVDRDGSIRKHTRANPGNVIVYGYQTADSLAPSEFTSSIPGKEVLPVERIVATASLKGGSAMIEVDVVHPPAPHVLAAIYAKNGVSLTGPLNTISGFDRCGALSSKPPIYVRSPSAMTGPALFQGTPSFPQQGPLDINLVQAIASLKQGAMVVTTHQSGVNWGNPTAPFTVYVDSLSISGGLTIRNATGEGILLVEGDVTLEGPIQWRGLIISSGRISVNGATGSIRVEGGIWTKELVDMAGSLNVTYDSCAIKTAILSQPLVVTKWRQVL